jgi:hypothetical protein
MRRITWAVLVTVGLGVAAPVLAYDPDEGDPYAYDGEHAGDVAPASAATAVAQDPSAGAGSMEPQERESDADRAERDFVASVWNSP